MSALMQQFVSGLKSRNDETRQKAARELHHYVSTELREVSVDDLTTFMDEFNHHIFEMVSSQDVNEKTGGILAIGVYALLCVWSIYACILKLLSTDLNNWNGTIMGLFDSILLCALDNLQ